MLITSIGRVGETVLLHAGELLLLVVGEVDKNLSLLAGFGKYSGVTEFNKDDFF